MATDNSGYNRNQQVIPGTSVDVSSEISQAQGETGSYKQLIARRHPEYQANIAWWQLFNDAYEGGKAVIDGDYLIKHPREEAGEFLSRKRRAYYLNYCGSVVNQYTSFITQKEVERSTEDAAFLEFFKNVDGEGMSISELQRKLSTLSSVYGIIYILVDNPMFNEDDIHTKADEDEQGILPFVRIYTPINVLDWATDDKGNFHWVLLRENDIDNPDPFHTDSERTTKQFRLWTKDAWYLIDGSGKLLDKGTNPINRVPLISIFHKEDDDSDLGISLLADIARVNLAIYNWGSLADEIIYNQTFSTLTVPEDKSYLMENGEEGEGAGGEPIVVGTTKVLRYPFGSMVPPTYISPDAGCLMAIINQIQSTVEEIYRMSALGNAQGSQVQQAMSGIAMAYDFTDTSQVIADKAAHLEEGEYDILELVDLWLGGPGEIADIVSIIYPDHYDVQTPLELLAMWAGIEALPVDAAKRAWLIHYLPKIIPMDEATKELIMKEAVAKEFSLDGYSGVDIPSGEGGY